MPASSVRSLLRIRGVAVRVVEIIRRAIGAMLGGGCAAGWSLVAVLAMPALASDIGGLADLSLEELMNESVTSVSKKEQKLADVAAAIAVLSNDDLRRSGATSVPEALRLVPGMNVASVNSSEWAVSARGFNDVFSKKLLVLVDGRAVYSPIFSGVYWDLQQTMLEDVDRIEVIRGPGATVWGANAVNGVISVVTRSARDTPGGFLYAGGGDRHTHMAGARFGGRIGENTFYRIFGSTRADDAHVRADGQSAQDAWRAQHGGFRVDHYPDADTQLTWQADATGMQRIDDTITGSGFNMLGRWSRRLAAGSSVEFQAYYDRAERDSLAQAQARTDTMDVTAQHIAELSSRQTVVWGLGYRGAQNTATSTNPFVFVRNREADLHLYSAFVQDEFQLVPDQLALTAGVKLEHNDFNGFEFQPSLRAVFKPAANQTVWAAVSRAVRTPTTVEGMDMFGVVLGAPFTGPAGGAFLPTATGNGSPENEVLWAYEAGYRAQVSKHVTADVAIFQHDYDKLINYGDVTAFMPGVPFGTAEIPALNILSARSHGAEASIVVAATDVLRFTANYTYLRMDVRAPVTFALSTGASSAPRDQISLRVAYDFMPRASLDVQVRRVGAVEGAAVYTTADLRLAWRATEKLELSLVGQSLGARQHLEQGSFPFAQSAEVPRAWFGRLAWHF